MVFQTYKIREVLAGFVDHIVFMSGREMGTGVAFPRMNQTIIINLGSPFGVSEVYQAGVPLRGGVDGVWINGKQDEPFLLGNDGSTAMYAIGLKLGMVPYFAGLPAMETNNLAVGAEDWGTGSRLHISEIALLREQLMGCSIEAGFNLIERYLLSLVKGSDLSELRKVQWLGRAMVTRPVEDLCRELGVTRKRLRSEAQYYFGDAVKNIQGIIRLNQTLGKIATETTSSLSALHDYFDQSHFIRDFKARTGITPSQYRRLCRQFPVIAKTPNFLPLSRETFLQFISATAD
jgi:AraC-like DNA-binding protein